MPWKKGNKSQNSDYRFNVRRGYLQVKLGDKRKPRSFIARCNLSQKKKERKKKKEKKQGH